MLVQIKDCARWQIHPWSRTLVPITNARRPAVLVRGVLSREVLFKPHWEKGSSRRVAAFGRPTNGVPLVREPSSNNIALFSCTHGTLLRSRKGPSLALDLSASIPPWGSPGYAWLPHISLSQLLI